MFNLNNLFRSSFHDVSHLTNYVSLRWKNRPRKPFWLGLAKTKLFVIPQRKVIPQDQVEELKRVNEIYERQMKALKNMSIIVDDDEEKRLETVQNYIEDAKINLVKWNAESARLREERLKLEEEKSVELIMNKINENEKRRNKIKAKVEAIVQKEIEISNTYITKENLDEAIDKCLENVSDYNYAMDLSGNIYKGKNMKPVDKMMAVKDLNKTNEMVKKSL